ncbi:hypothetical protein KJ632_00740 [Patescibacteria group bacterium]|nr:hypothetical protein [Patescibacteria group bacterium]
MNLIKTVQALLSAKAIIWIFLGISYAIYQTSGNSYIPIYVIVSIFFVNALISAFLAWKVVSKKVLYFYLILLFTLINIFLTFADQVGVWDLIVFGFDISILSLLFFSKRHFSTSKGSRL